MQTMMDQERKSSASNGSFKVPWKKDRVISVDPEAPLWEAVQLMKQHHIGDVLVMDRANQREPIGMITDRDIALCMSGNVEFKSLRVMDVMSPSVVTASVNDDLFQMISVMKNSGVTRLPLLDERQEVVGIVTAKNILQVLAGCFLDMTQISEQQQENELRNQH